MPHLFTLQVRKWAGITNSIEFTQCMSEEMRPKCGVTDQGSKEGREGWHRSGQNRLRSTGGARAGQVGAGSAGIPSPGIL